MPPGSREVGLRAAWHGGQGSVGEFPSTTCQCLPYCHAVLLKGGSGVRCSFAAQWCFVLGPVPYISKSYHTCIASHILSFPVSFIPGFQFSHAALGPGSLCHPPIQVAKVLSWLVMLPWGPGLRATPLFRWQEYYRVSHPALGPGPCHPPIQADLVETISVATVCYTSRC